MTEIYIESSKQSDRASSSTDNHRWTSTVGSGIKLDPGDIISVESSSISIRGDINQSVEFQGKLPGTNLLDNEMRMRVAYYMSNNMQFNCPLPLRGTTVKFADPQISGYGYVDLSNYSNFEKSYPMRGIEGVYISSTDPSGLPVYDEVPDGGVGTSAPASIKAPTNDRFYVQDTAFPFTPPPLLLTEDQQTFTLLEKDINFRLDEGYNSLANIQSNLTNQMHTRFGTAESFDNDQVVPDYVYYLDGTAGVDGSYRREPQPGLSDVCYINYPTASANVVNDRLEGNWSATLESEGNQPKGTGYVETEGEKMYWKGIASATPYNMKASQNIMFNIKNYKNATNIDITDPSFPTYGMYTGGASINGAGVGEYGISGMVLIDTMDQVNIGIDHTCANNRTTDTTISDIDCLITTEPNTVLVTNLIYNQQTIDNLAGIEIDRLEYQTEQDSTFIMDLKIGKADDEASFFDRVVNLSCPLVNLAGSTPANSYITNTYRSKPSLAKGNDTLQVYSRYDETIMNDLTNLKFPISSDYKHTNTKGQVYSRELSRVNNLPIIPVFKRGGSGSILDIPFVAFVIKDQITPVASNYIPYPIRGEYIGWSNSHYDNKNSFIVTTQKKFSPYLTGNDANFYSPYQYRSTVKIGAPDPQISFDSSLNRFSIGRLHFLLRPGSGPFQQPLKVANEQAEEESIGFNFATTSITLGLPDNTLDDYGGIPSKDIISAQSGIGITRFQIPDYIGNYYLLTDANYKNCLLDKLGFILQDIYPVYGRVNTQFNKTAIFLANTIYLKNQNTVYPLTTNASINCSVVPSLILNSEQQQAANCGAIPIEEQTLTNQESDEIIARNLPSKLTYPFFVILSDINHESTYYGSANGQQKLCSIGYANLSFATGGYIYGSSPFQFTVKKPTTLSEITIEIRRPDGSVPQLDNKSIIIFKLVKNQQTTSK